MPTKPSVDELLEKLPKIATAVNAFKSEAVQQQVVGAILTSWSAGAATDSGTPGADPAPPASKARRRRAKAGDSDKTADDKPKRGRRRAGGYSIVKDLNLRPAGKPTFAAFVAEKQPDTMSERIAVAVYFLKHTVEVEKVSADHVFSCFRDQQSAGWRLPTNLANLISVTASRNGWLSYEDQSDIAMSAPGENLVVHDLPRKKSS